MVKCGRFEPAEPDKTYTPPPTTPKQGFSATTELAQRTVITPLGPHTIATLAMLLSPKPDSSEDTNENALKGLDSAVKRMHRSQSLPRSSDMQIIICDPPTAGATTGVATNTAPSDMLVTTRDTEPSPATDTAGSVESPPLQISKA